MADIKILLIALMLVLSVAVFVAAQGIPPQTTSVQTGNYTALAADSGKMIVMNCATNCTLTLPPTIQSPNWVMWVSNMGAGTVTINPNGLQLNGTSASITLASNGGASAYVTTDNTNYYATIGVSPFVASIKPTIAVNAIQYVDAVNGSDANDGLSPGSAKSTGCHAYDALRQYFGIGHYGQIIISGTYNRRPYWCFDVPYQGVWFMSDNDRNFVTISSIARSSGVVTATVSPNPNNGALPLYVNNTNHVNGRIQVIGVTDPSFNGQFVVTSMPAKNQIRWLQAGPDTKSRGGNGWPAGFRVLSNQNSVTISGSVSGPQTSTNAFYGKTFINAGSPTNTLFPALWLADASITIENLIFQYPAQWAKVGIDTSYDRSGPGGVAGATIRNVACGLNAIDGAGPGMDIGGNTFWFRVYDSFTCGNNFSEQRSIVGLSVAGGVATLTGDHILPVDLVAGSHISVFSTSCPSRWANSLNGTHTIATVSGAQLTFATSSPDQTCSATGFLFSDRAYGVIIDPGKGAGGGSVVWRNGSPAPIKTYGGANGSSADLTDFTMEGDFQHYFPPALHIGPGGGANSMYRLERVDLADLPNDPRTGTYALYNEAVGSERVLVSNVSGLLAGPATVIASAGFGTFFPEANRQVGLSGYAFPRLIGRHEGHVRQLGAAAVRYPNLANTNPSAWLPSSGATVTNVLSPDGNMNAGRISGGSAGGSGAGVLSAGPLIHLNVGDVYAGIAMTRALNGSYAGQNSPFSIGFTGLGYGAGNTCAETGAGSSGSGQGSFPYTGYYGSDGEWDIYEVRCTVMTSSGTANAHLQMWFYSDSTHAVDVFMPVLLRIPAADYPSSVSWTEIQDYMDSMIFFGTNAPQGTVATLPHADFAMGGAGDQFFTRWTHSYTGNHQVSLPNADGTVMFGSGTSCAMSSGTTCKATVPNTATKCIAMQQGTGTVISGECSVSGTTATVTASLSNSSTWAIVAF
jgi:hypothetical protein